MQIQTPRNNGDVKHNLTFYKMQTTETRKDFNESYHEITQNNDNTKVKTKRSRKLLVVEIASDR